MVTINRGDVVLCDLNPVTGTEQAGIRPAVILKIDRANVASPHTVMAPFTTKNKARPPVFPCSYSGRRRRIEPGFGCPL